MMNPKTIRAAAALMWLGAGTLMAQKGADPTARYHRLVCLVQLLGSGKRDDPIRPEFVPGPSAAPAHSGIVSWTFQLTDDNKMAIVQIVAPDRRAFDTIFQAIPSRPDIQVFEIGKDSKTTIENAIGKVKQGFSLKNFGVAAR